MAAQDPSGADPSRGRTVRDYQENLMRKARHLNNRHPQRADLITLGDPGYAGAPQPVSQRC
jgi:hypothetical protein